MPKEKQKTFKLMKLIAGVYLTNVLTSTGIHVSI